MIERIGQALTPPGSPAPALLFGRVDFRKTVFTTPADFSGTIFAGHADFRGANFSRDADFRTTAFAEHSDFRGAIFAGNADFREAKFSKRTDFGRTVFTRGADFSEATFTENSDFGGATFTEDAGFRGTNFIEYADFGRAKFLRNVSFVGTTFTENANFRTTRFTQHANFGDVTFVDTANFRTTTFAQLANFDGATFAKQATYSGATFTENADFNGTNFAEDAAFRGTTFTGEADFREATFAKYANFLDATFAQDTSFHGATFTQNANFGSAEFSKRADFPDAFFSQDVQFPKAIFNENANFSEATFKRDANFGDARFAKGASFEGATFTQNADFSNATFATGAVFAGVTFAENERLGPLTADHLDLRGAQFGASTTIEAETGAVTGQRARFAGGVELRIRHGRVDLAEAFLGAASSLATSATTFTVRRGSGDLVSLRASPEQIARWHAASSSIDHRPVLVSLRGTDVSELALTDVDLRWCRFAGAHHLDKLRIEGDSPFPRPPQAWWRDARQVVFEEHPWRAGRDPASGWLLSAPFDTPTDRVERVGPDRLAALYRSLRKALEDGKNEAGAGDFYYGEQEARRRADGSSPVERAILGAYWMISGYGQRAFRVLLTLLGVITVATVLLITCGLPAPGPASQSTTTAHGQQTITIVEDPPPHLPPGSARWTWSRADTSVRIALGAVVFRDASQKLTAAGVWTVMVARFAGPILLALAALAVRARVKR